LFGDGVAHSVITVLNWHRKKKDLPRLLHSAEIVQFDHRIVGDGFSPDQVDAENLATAASYPAEVINAALRGRLLPLRVCDHILKAGTNPDTHLNVKQLSIVPVHRGDRGLFRPLANPDVLRGWLETI
jgi:hypothetical protein